MAYTDIDKPDLYFNTVLYTGNGSTQSITGVGFQPDETWIKCRNINRSHRLFDSVRGAGKRLVPDGNQAENTSTTLLNSFDSDGFTLGTAGAVNAASDIYVSWNWLASNTTGSNINGSITSTVSVNTTSGFSIVSYTGTGSTATVGHGLGVTPAMIIVKDRTNAGANWVCWNKNFSNLTNDYIILNNTDAKGTFSNYWGTSAPTSSVFGLGSGGLDNNRSSADIIAYCFADKKGFSKFGTYIGNGSSDGTFVYTGFKPAMVIMKKIDSAGNNWRIFDNKRSTSGFNVTDLALRPNTNNVEFSSNIDFVSNGVKIRNIDAETNTSGATYIYMAFAESPFTTSTGIPTTAR